MDDTDPVASAVQSQLQLASSFDHWLDQQLAKRKPGHEQLISAIKSRVGSYRKALAQMEAANHHSGSGIETAGPDPAEAWVLAVHIQPESTTKITISVPGVSEDLEILAKNQQEADSILGNQYLGYIKKVFQAFAQAEKDIHDMLELSGNVHKENKQLRNAPDQTVKTHIRLLKEYNDMKDIGQQMMGLIAENKNVPIRSLYEHGEYGVTEKD